MTEDEAAARMLDLLRRMEADLADMKAEQRQIIARLDRIIANLAAVEAGMKVLAAPRP